jgi:hypothetical protein
MDLWQIYHDISVVNAFIGISPGTSFSAKAILHLASPLKQRTAAANLPKIELLGLELRS